MLLRRSNIFYGWFVVAGGALVVFGVAGSQFSFGVFLKPMTEDFGRSRATLSLAFGTTFLLSGLLRPVAGYLADRYSPRLVALSGVVVTGGTLLFLPIVGNLVQLYLIFAVMSLGITLASGPSLTKVVSAWFYSHRGVTLGLISGGGSVGAIILVPATSSFLVLFDWQEAYLFLGVLLLLLVLPVGYLLIRNRPQDMGLQPQGGPVDISEQFDGAPGGAGKIIAPDATFGGAIRTAFFWRLTFGYFV